MGESLREKRRSVAGEVKEERKSERKEGEEGCGENSPLPKDNITDPLLRYSKNIA